MNSIFLLFSVAFVFASINALSSAVQLELSTAVTKVCTAVSSNQQLAAQYYAKGVAELNNKAEKKFLQTLAYVNDATNKNLFLAGGDSCKQYFAGLQTPLKADFQAAGVSDQELAQKAIQFVRHKLNGILTALNAA